MENYKNRIITISGDPASGKGTVTKALKQLYEAEGFKVKVVSVGEIFRKVVVREYKKKFPDVEEPSLEDIQSDPNFQEELNHIDEKLDSEIAKIGEEFNSQDRPNEILIVDSRLAWFTINGAFDVKLTVDAETAGKRVFNDPKRGPEDRYSSEEEAIKDTASRKQLEIERYIKQYGADLTNLENFDLIINTTLANVNDIAKTIKICEELKRQGKPFTKTWASPELFYPTQSIRDTWSSEPGFTAGMSLEELAESIKKIGIFPDAPVCSKTITDSPYQFVSDGHHRVFASIMAGITLIPYRANGNVEKATVSSQRALSSIYDHEDATRKPDGTYFRYAKYPTIDERSEPHDIAFIQE